MIIFFNLSWRSPSKVVADGAPWCGPIPTPEETTSLRWSRLANKRLAAHHTAMAVVEHFSTDRIDERMKLRHRSWCLFQSLRLQGLIDRMIVEWLVCHEWAVCRMKWKFIGNGEPESLVHEKGKKAEHHQGRNAGGPPMPAPQAELLPSDCSEPDRTCLGMELLNWSTCAQMPKVINWKIKKSSKNCA